MKFVFKNSSFNHSLLSSLGIIATISVAACSYTPPVENATNPYVVDYRDTNKIYVEKKKERFILTALGENVHLPVNTTAFDDFVNDFKTRGDSNLEVLVPGIKGEGEISEQWADTVNAELIRRGINPAKIKTRIIKVPQKECFSKCIVNDEGKPVDISASPCKPRPIVIRFMAYKANVPECGSWESQNNPNRINQPSENFGCATQRNIGLMVANPKDLIKMRTPDGAMAARTADILEKYASGEATPSAQELQSTISDVAN